MWNPATITAVCTGISGIIVSVTALLSLFVRTNPTVAAHTEQIKKLENGIAEENKTA